MPRTIILTSEQALKLAEMDMMKSSYRVLLYLMTQLSTKGLVKVNQTKIYQSMSINKTQVSVAISELVELGILQRSGYNKAYHKINPNILELTIL